VQLDFTNCVCTCCLRRLAYAHWLTQWVLRLDPKASDELLLVTRGRNVEGWRLVEIKRDDYAPNSGGQRQWDMDRKKWQSDRLTNVMKVGRLAVKGGKCITGSSIATHTTRLAAGCPCASHATAADPCHYDHHTNVCCCCCILC
jgi:hypothetical protein